MSLLMKALEKAAKDRGEARAEPAANPAESRPEVSLALELLAADTPSPRPREERRATAPVGQEPATGYYRADVSRTPTLAAENHDSSGVRAYLQDHPVAIFGAVAALFAIGFGAYVYVQVFHPALLIQRAPPPAIPPALSEAPAAVSVPASAQPIPTASVLALAPAAALQLPPTPASLPPAPAAAPPAEISESAPAAKPVNVAPGKKTETAKPRENIVVKRGESMVAVHPVLNEAYAALKEGQTARAEELYGRLLRAEPKNTDALLGLAAIAASEDKPDEAAAHYRAILESEPRHALAQSALIGLTARSDPLAAESHLKHMIAREPSAYAYFTLGNLYADQTLWAQAQQAYFQAHHLEPDNPDYAYNLAVALEHISQPRLGLQFYRRALELAAARTRIHFDPARARERIATLAARAE